MQVNLRYPPPRTAGYARLTAEGEAEAGLCAGGDKISRKPAQTVAELLMLMMNCTINPPTPCLWQAPVSTQKTKRKTGPAIRRSAR